MDLQPLLQASINQYSDILSLLGAITDPGRLTRSEEINKAANTLLEKQECASDLDTKIMRLLDKTMPELCNQKTIKERSELIHKVIKLNKQITPKIESIKSLISCELQQLKAGRSAMKGYQVADTTHGKNVNNTL
jgi:metal-responsive CopG/Arc/MetJ family transcriptional regulator